MLPDCVRLLQAFFELRGVLLLLYFLHILHSIEGRKPLFLTPFLPSTDSNVQKKYSRVLQHDPHAIHLTPADCVAEATPAAVPSPQGEGRSVP
mgnify:CR=1 FL=1